MPIERVAVGDSVLGAPPDDLVPGNHDVTGLHRGSTRTVYEIGIGGAGVRCTAGHRFLVPGTGWVRADGLSPGQTVHTGAGTGAPVSRVDRIRLTVRTTTYDLDVQNVGNYFVRVGEHWVLVHNGGDPPDFDRTLFWHLAKAPGLRDDDRDGLSAWRTDSRDEVNTLMDHRVNFARRNPRKDTYISVTPEELTRAGLAFPETPSTDPLAEKLQHHSIRPVEATGVQDLTTAQMDTLRDRLREPAWEQSKPKEVTGC